LGGHGEGTGANNGFESAPKAPCEDFPQSEKLRLKRTASFYVSDHPLKSLRQSAQILAPINLAQLSDQREEPLCAVVMLTNVKRQRPRAIAWRLSKSKTGQTEAVVFPKPYDALVHCLLQILARSFGAK